MWKNYPVWGTKQISNNFLGAKEIFDGLKFFGIFDFVNWLNDCVWNPNFGPLLSPTFHLDTVKYVYDSDRYV